MTYYFTILLHAIGLLAVSFLVQMVAWRIIRPRNQTVALCFVFWGVYAMYGVISPYFISLPFSWYLFLFLLYSTIFAAYVASFPALEAESPSLLMVMAIAAAGTRGMSKDALFAMMNNEVLLKPRFQELIDARMIQREQGTYVVTSLGKRFVSIFNAYRRLIHRDSDGG